MNQSWQERIEAAASRIAPHVHRTPVVQWPDTNAWLKLENEQVTGSFKARGGGNKLLCLSAADRARGVVTASSGNHGAGVAHAAAALGCPLVVFVPTHADPAKVEKIRALGAQVTPHGDDCVETEAHARAWAAQSGMPYISPYNDAEVVAGQGTIGVELLEQLPNLDAVFISVGGGGLISGIGTYLKARKPDVEIVACSPARSPAMHRCLEAGSIIDVPCADTLSDATAGGVEPGAITFELCRAVIDRCILVEEEQIAHSMRQAHARLGIQIEGAAGVALSAWAATASDYRDKTAAIIICGGNVDPETFHQVLNNGEHSSTGSG